MPSPITAAPPPETGFDPLAFWIQHKSKILVFAGLFVVGLLTFAAFQYTQRRSREAAEQAFENAKTPEDLRKVIADHPRTVAAANAQLLLAEALRRDGKHEEAISTLRAFINQNPDHPLISGAWTSLAFSLETQ